MCQSGAVECGDGGDHLGEEAGAEATGLQGWLARREGQGEEGELPAVSLLLQVFLSGGGGSFPASGTTCIPTRVSFISYQE